MAHFRGTMQGMRGEASRLGSKGSGINVRVNGWHCGVHVVAYYDTVRDCDVFEIRATGGSNADCHEVPVATITREAKHITIRPDSDHAEKA